MYMNRLDYLHQKQTELDAATSDIDSLRASAARAEAEKARHGVKYTCSGLWSFRLLRREKSWKTSRSLGKAPGRT